MKVWASSAQAILVDSRVFTSDFAFYGAILLEFDNAEDCIINKHKEGGKCLWVT